MAFLKSIASVFQPREVKVVRERQERSVKVTEKNDPGPHEWKWTVNHWIYSLSCDRLVLTIATVQFLPLESSSFLFEDLGRPTSRSILNRPWSFNFNRPWSMTHVHFNPWPSNLNLTSKIDYILDYMMRIQIMPSDQVSLWEKHMTVIDDQWGCQEIQRKGMVSKVAGF